MVETGGKMSEEQYLHCRTCLGSQSPNYRGHMEAYVKDGELHLVCKNCKRDVFKTILAESMREHLGKCSCAMCDKEK
jgi:hypothetical protein